MSVYQYIANSDPRGAELIINSFGYEITDRRDLGQSLTELVAQVGKPALVKIMEYHPDKDIILELNPKNESKDGCYCKNCSNSSNREPFFNASGSETVTATKNENIMAHQTNAIMVIATVLVVGALLLKNK